MDAVKVTDVGLRSAWRWIAEAAKLFRAEPLRWTGLLSVWMLLTLGLFFLLPPVSSLLALILQPALFGGLVLAARDQQAGLPLRTGHLLAAFKGSGRALVLVGVATMLAEIVSFTLLLALGFPQAVPLDANQEPDFQAFVDQFQGKEALLLLVFALSALIKSVFWFATPLLALHPMPAAHALRWSFYAWIANFLPMALFALMMTGFLLLAMLPSGLGMLVFVPVYALTQYTSYQAVFREA